MRARVGKRTLIIAAAFYALLNVEAVAEAYCLHVYTGAKRFAKWKTPPVSYKLSTTIKDAAIKAAIGKAFSTWGRVACSKLTFKNGGGFDITKEVFAKHNQQAILVYWYTSSAGFPTNAKYVAYTFTGHDNDGGLSFASIAVNAFNTKWNTTGGDAQKGILDVQNELTYLIGSVIGLGDSNDPKAVMNPAIAFGSTAKHKLTQDDIDALVYLYPKTGACKAPQPGSNGCTAGAPPKADGGTKPAGDGGGAAGDGGGIPAPDGGPIGGDGVTPGFDTGAGPGGDLGASGCTASSQCPAGQVCTVEGNCVNGATDEGGCGCRASSGGGESAVLLSLLVALLISRRRRDAL